MKKTVKQATRAETAAHVDKRQSEGPSDARGFQAEDPLVDFVQARDQRAGRFDPETGTRHGAGQMKYFLGVFFAILLASGPVSAAAGTWPHAVTYEIFVRSFADSNADGVGDLRGLTSKLDYLQSLGVEALWLMPISPSPSYHKYDVTDYRAIDPEYGTMQDFAVFVAEAKKRGLRVILDLVINHTARQHPWFQAALADGGSPEFSYYVWKNENEVGRKTVERTGPDTDNLRRWNEAKEHPDQLYYAYFTGGMPDLNFDNPEVRRTVFDIGRFWLEKGVDGFRLDAAKHIFPEGREADSVAFWREFRAEMQAVNPDVLLVGEVWADGQVTRDFLPGLGSVFNFELSGRILDALKSGRGAGLAAWQADLLKRYREAAPDFVDATFLTNHDQNRVLSQLGDKDKARVAAALLLTLPGSPYLYYGEEIGMLGTKPDPFIREPMLWQREPDPSRTRSDRMRHSRDSTVPPVAAQEGDPTSLLNHYRNLIFLRNTTPALSRGAFEPVEGLHERLVPFVRQHEQGNALVLHNVGHGPVAVDLTGRLAAFQEVRWKSSEGVVLGEGKITLPSLTSAVLQ
jgi:glycosidase